ncbi:TAXI family TRAP transporter solute-binding subunit [Thermodesulfobacteriota bacterium]
MAFKKYSIWMLLMGFVFITFYSFSSDCIAKEKQTSITLLGSPIGSDGMAFSFATADLINKTVPWIECSAVETMGNVGNIKSMLDFAPDRKKGHIFVSADLVLNLALNGKGPFKKTGPITGWKVLFTHYNAASHAMTLDPNIRSPKDLIGKRIGMPPKGHGLTRVALWIFDKCWGIKDKVKFMYMPMPMLKDVLIDGTIDAVACGGMYFSPEDGIKVSPFNEAILASRKDARAIGVSREEYENARSKDPRAPLTWGPIKANSLRPGYPDKDTGTVNIAVTVAAWENMDNKIAYEIVKVIGENNEKYKDYFAKGKAMRLKTLTSNAWSEKRYHPGALKYFREIGLGMPGTL